MFHLKSEQNKDGTRLIYLIFSYHAIRLKMSTKQKIHPDNWDEKRERPKRGYKYYSQISALLDRIDTALHESYYELQLTCIPSKDMLKAAIKEKLYKSAPLTVSQYAAKYAEDKTGIGRTTKQHLQNVARQIAKFNPRLTFDQIDLATMLEFRDYLYAQKFESNTVSSMFKRFKTVLHDAVEKGVTTNLKFKNRKAQAPIAETTAIFLTEEDLDKIRLADIPEWLWKYRDLLLVACYCGVRFSDILKINKTSFVDGGKHFRITDQKENNLAIIPLHPVVLEVMHRYDWSLPKTSNVKMNLYIKEVGRLAKIDQDITVTRFPGGVRTNEIVPKWAMITTHTGRRSLISNLIISGMNREVIKSISGHKSEAAFSKYIRLSSTDHLKLAYKSSFFRGKLRTV